MPTRNKQEYVALRVDGPIRGTPARDVIWFPPS